MPRVKDIEPLINNYTGSKECGKLFGVKLRYTDGTSRNYTDLGLALCADLTNRQRAYIQKLKKERYG